MSVLLQGMPTPITGSVVFHLIISKITVAIYKMLADKADL